MIIWSYSLSYLSKRFFWLQQLYLHFVTGTYTGSKTSLIRSINYHQGILVMSYQSLITYKELRPTLFYDLNAFYLLNTAFYSLIIKINTYLSSHFRIAKDIIRKLLVKVLFKKIFCGRRKFDNSFNMIISGFKSIHSC